MLRRDNIFHPRDRKKQYSKKKGKKKESNHLVTRTGLAPLRNFVIPFRFDHDHGEKKRIPCYIPSMKFTDRRDPIDPSFVHFFSIFYLILPPLVLFSSSSFLLFFRNRSRVVGKKEKIGYADTWRLKGNEKRRKREREAILLFYYLFYEVHRRRGRFREFIFNPCCRLLSIRYSDNFCFEKPW